MVLGNDRFYLDKERRDVFALLLQAWRKSDLKAPAMGMVRQYLRWRAWLCACVCVPACACCVRARRAGCCRLPTSTVTQSCSRGR